MAVLLNRVTAPAGAPVSLADVKMQMRVDYNDDDYHINGLIEAATATFEEMTGCALVAQTWDLSMRVPGGRVYLPKVPVQSITSISYYDRDEAQQSATVGDFHLFNDIHRAWVEPKDGKTWPDLFDRPDALTIRFVAGYATIEAVPKEIRHAILLLVAHWYEQRSAASDASMSEVPFSVQTIASLHQRQWIGA